MKVSAKLNNFRMPNRKVKLVADLMIGMDVVDALNQLNATAKKTAPFLITLLDSAIANGENNFGISKDNMYIFDVVVKEGITLKRWMPKAYGRATPIRRRSSHIEIVLEERVEGKDRKTKEQLEKEKKARLDARKKLEKDSIDKQEKETKAIEKNEVKSKDARTETKASDKGWAKKMFNRKAGM
ncbi:MAG: 50S ribosomal protein L22 [Candidatus Moranbacteria bacterium GW2011_GWA2_39_41]|nr:MAG: 50S ribosomal protein L22 [Candidatus Moranbacteria bacterium GW2011_GWA2_39_41]